MSIFALIVLLLSGYFLGMAIYYQVVTKYPNWTSRLWAIPMMLLYSLGVYWGMTNLNPAPTMMGGRKHRNY
jgi:hypothetical protein